MSGAWTVEALDRDGSVVARPYTTTIEPTITRRPGRDAGKLTLRCRAIFRFPHLAHPRSWWDRVLNRPITGEQVVLTAVVMWVDGAEVRRRALEPSVTAGPLDTFTVTWDLIVEGETYR